MLAEERANVILITIDTLRSDHLEAYGYQGGKTPTTTALSRESVLFENVVVQTPLTLPSHISILTGTYPFYHGVQGNLASLGKEIPTLAEWFKARGYATGAVLGAAVLMAERGLNRGFDVYDDNFPFPQVSRSISSSPPEKPQLTDQLVSLSERPAERVATLALRWLETNREGPFFLWVHFFDPHDPYTPPEPFKTEFKDKLYDGEIAYLETQLASFFRELKRLGLYENSLLVFTSDHGESLGEHKEMFHAYYIYDASLRVPLMFKIPPALARGQIKMGQRLEGQVRSVDIAPTIIQLLGERVPEYMQGEGLVGAMTGRRTGEQLPAYAETHYPRYFGSSPLFSLSNSRHKYIEAPIPELYDLREDPAELRNIFEGQSVLANQLKTQMYELQRRFAPMGIQTEGEQADPESVERLQALGYVAFSTGGSQLQEYDLPDPKLKIDAHGRVIRALEFSREGDSETAIKMMKEVVLEEPEAPFGHFMLASEYFRAKLFLMAAEHFQKAVELQPDSDAGARFNLARSLFHAGLSSQSEQVANELLQANPSHFGARHLRANLLAKRGDYEQAVKEEQSALEIRPYYLPALNNLASYYLELGDTAAAIEVYQKGLEVDPKLVLLRRNLALAYLKNRSYAKAMNEAGIVTELFPNDSLGFYYLGQAYAGRGMAEEARAAFRKAKELDPMLSVPTVHSSNR